MTDTAREFFTDVYGDVDFRNAEAHSSWITTAVGPREVVLDPPNLRVKTYDLSIADLAEPVLSGLIEGLADDTLPFTKLTVYARGDGELAWVARGFLKEGLIQGFFADGHDAEIWALYGDDDRSTTLRDAAHDRIVLIAEDKKPADPQLPSDLTCRIGIEAEAGPISALLQECFADYPTPLDAGTIGRSIRRESHRFRQLCNAQGETVAVASAEIDHRRKAAELTDCATRPDQRGRGLMSYLLRELERDMVRDYGIRDLYTLARADEVGMNCAFAKLGYVFTGRLVNNCRMPNGWESVNIWCRRAADEGRAAAGGTA